MCLEQKQRAYFWERSSVDGPEVDIRKYIGLFYGYLGLFGGYDGLLFEYIGLFCACTELTFENVYLLNHDKKGNHSSIQIIRLFCGYIGVFCGYIGLFCDHVGHVNGTSICSTTTKEAPRLNLKFSQDNWLLNLLYTISRDYRTGSWKCLPVEPQEERQPDYTGLFRAYIGLFCEYTGLF